MKRTKQTVQSLPLHAALFNDIAARDRGLCTSLDADLLRLENIVRSRGISFILGDMPKAGKVLDRALSSGTLVSEDLPESFGRIHNGRRPFLGCLFERLFDDVGRLRDDAETTAVADLRQVLYLCKKVREACPDKDTLAEVDAFRRIDSSLRMPSHDWLSDRPDFLSPARRVDMLDCLRTTPDMVSQRDTCEVPLLVAFQLVSDILSLGFKRQFDWRSLRPKHGKGAVADAKTGTDKYQFPTWPDKLDSVFPISYFACSREDMLAHHEELHARFRREPPVRLLAVPKDYRGPRMIASEPTSHQFIQLGLMRWLRKNLPKSLTQCLDFQRQEPSRVLCLQASVTGDMATVDLSAASDRLSCWTVERVFRQAPSLLQALHAARSRWLVNASGYGEPYYLSLRKYAPMGNGTTFPVQSIVYAMCCIAAILFEEGSSINKKTIHDAASRCRVYGDDIILPSRAVPTLTLLLEHLQLVVNHGKTHVSGHFRESCGCDAFRGQDVTPGYLRDLELGGKPQDLVSWLDVLKTMHSKHHHWLVEEMKSQIPAKWRSLLPCIDRPLGCLTLPECCWEIGRASCRERV